MHPIARLLLAVGLSALVHLSLIYGLTLKPPSEGLGVGQVIHARLQPGDPPSVPDSQRKAQADKLPVIERLRRTSPAPAAEVEPGTQALAKVSLTQAPVEAAAGPPPLPVLIDAAIYTPREVDVFPKPVDAIKPPFPRRASDDHVSGAVTLELIIDEYGAVQEARVLEANPEGYFEESALKSFEAARFSPGQKDGKPVRCRLAIKVDFEWDPTASQSVAGPTR